MSFVPALLLLSSFVSAAAPWRENLERAEKYAVRGSSAEAAAAAEAAFDAAAPSLGDDAPEVFDLLRRIRRIYREAGDDSRLREMKRRLSAAPRKGYGAWYVLGIALRDEHKWADAEKAMKQALAAKPDDDGAEEMLASIAHERGELAEEAELIEKRAARAPLDYAGYIDLAKTYARLGRPDMAKKTFARARKAAGGEAESYVQQGYFYLDRGDSADALASFSAAIAVDTSSPAGYHHLGAYFYRRGQYAEAEKNFRVALTLSEADPKTDTGDLLHTMHWLGDALREQGKYSEAEAVYLRGLEIDPTGPRRTTQLLKSLAKLYVDSGRYAEAEKALRRAADACAAPRRCPVQSGAAVELELGQFLIARGRAGDAAEVAGRLAKLCETESFDGRFTILKGLAELYSGLHDDAKREALYLRLLPLRASMPFNSELVWVEKGLAEMDAARGRTREAAELYEKAGAILEHGGYAKDAADAREKARALEAHRAAAGAPAAAR